MQSKAICLAKTHKWVLSKAALHMSHILDQSMKQDLNRLIGEGQLAYFFGGRYSVECHAVHVSFNVSLLAVVDGQLPRNHC